MNINNSILLPNSVMALNVDSKNRSFKADRDIQNGMVFSKGELSTEANETEVFNAVLPTADETGLFMAFTAEESVVTINGQNYKFGLDDPRIFTNAQGLVFSGFQLERGDIVTISTSGVNDGSAEEYLIADPSTGKLSFSATAGNGLAFKVIESTYLSLGGASYGSLAGTQRVPAYKIEVVQN